LPHIKVQSRQMEFCLPHIKVQSTQTEFCLPHIKVQSTQTEFCLPLLNVQSTQTEFCLSFLKVQKCLPDARPGRTWPENLISRQAGVQMTGWKPDKRDLPKPWLPFLIARHAKIMNSGIIWAFDPGKGSIGENPSPRWGEGGRRPDEVNKNSHHTFLHKASLLIPADFAETQTAAGRRRMWRTRQAHGSPARSRNATRPFGRAASSRRWRLYESDAMNPFPKNRNARQNTPPPLQRAIRLRHSILQKAFTGML
jgi:hypothetical protein